MPTVASVDLARDVAPPSPRALTVLVTGASGLLGVALTGALARDGHRAIGLARTPAFGATESWITASLEDFGRLAAIVADVRPDWIVHAAALTDIDACEREPAAARAIHVEASAALARAAQTHGSRLLYVSTDSVYDGDHVAPHHEDEAPCPLNRYAETKLAGEQACLTELPETIVARVNFFGLHPTRSHGLAAWLIGQLRAGRGIGGFTDVRFNPLFNRDLATLLVRAIERDLRGGCYNFGASDDCSKFDFARRIAMRIKADPALVRPTTLAEARLATLRPRFTVMATARLTAALGESMPTIDDGLTRLLPC